jgi:hypothetical protein
VEAISCAVRIDFTGYGRIRQRNTESAEVSKTQTKRPSPVRNLPGHQVRLRSSHPSGS